VNRLLLRIWAGIFVSIVIISTLVFVLITRYYGSFFENPDWYPVSSTAFLVQKILDRTPMAKIESESESLSRLLDRPIHVYSSGDGALPEIAKQLPDDDTPGYGVSKDDKKFFYAPIHGGNMIVAIDPSFNLYAPFFSPAAFFSQFIWIFLITAAAGFLLSRPIKKRLTALETAAEKIHRGDFSARIEVTASDLIGEVGMCFNQMANRIQAMFSSQQALLSGFVGKLQASNDVMIDHLKKRSFNSPVSDRRPIAEKLTAILDELERFVGNLLRNEKTIGNTAGPGPNGAPPPVEESHDNTCSPEETETPLPLSFLRFLRTLTGFKSSTFQTGILKFVVRVSIGILVALLFNHSFGLIFSQFGYKYLPGIANWYPARIPPTLIQYTADAASVQDLPHLLPDLQKSLRRGIDLVDTKDLPAMNTSLTITSGNDIRYGSYKGENVYFAPVHDGMQTLVIANGLDLLRHRPSLLLHLAMLPVELLFTVIGSILLSWPIIHRMKELERGLNRIRKGDLDTRFGIPSGRPIGNLANSFNDMAERIKLLITNRKHLIQAVGHEIRTPVYRIHFHLEMMLRDEGMEIIPRRIDGIREEIEELNALAEELRMFTGMEGRSYVEEEIAIGKELFDIVSQYQERTSRLSITLSGTPNDTATIHSPPIYFRRVVQNVITNAVRHARSRVSIRHGRVKDSVFIEICDDGPGVLPEDRDAIFEPFTRLDDSRNRKTGGFGLGLAITRRILAKHGGSVSVSDNIPCGAKFTICWPLKRPAGEG